MAYIGIVDYLKSQGKASDYSSRSSLASQYGIQNYQGTAEQNTQLLGFVQGGTSPSAPPVSPTPPTPPATGGTTGGAIILPNTTPSTQNTNDVGGMIDYWKTYAETKTKEAQDAQAKLDAQRATQTTQTQSWLDKITGAKSPEQIRQETTAQTGIEPTNYFAEEKASIAELDKLNTDYNAAVAARDQQISDVYGRTGQGLDFQNNQIAQINRNAAVTLNQMSANINSKAATFSAKQNMFNEAQNFINNAVSAATADMKYNVDMYDLFYDQNQDIIDNLDTKIQNAYKESQNAAQNAWTTAVDEKNQVGQLQMDNPQAGIDVSKDSLTEAMAKVARTPKAVKPDIFTANEITYQQEYNPITNTWNITPMPVSPTIPEPTIPTTTQPITTLTGKPLTDTQALSLGYAQRMNDAEKIITELGSKMTGWVSMISGNKYFPNILKSDDRQRFEQAERNFVNSILRKESGAAISPSEFASAAKQYFPQAGDSKAVVEQKTANRLRVISNLTQAANVSLESVIGSQNIQSGGTYEDYLKAIK